LDAAGSQYVLGFLGVVDTVMVINHNEDQVEPAQQTSLDVRVSLQI